MVLYRLLPLLLLALFLGCTAQTGPEPFDSAALLKQRFVAQLAANSPIAAKELEVPFELTPEIRHFLAKELPRPFREADQADEIVHLILYTLDLQYTLTPTRNAAETFHRREANCVSFVNLFVGIARERGLNAVYVEVEDVRTWNYRQGTVLSQGHLVAGLYVDGELRLYDFLPGPPAVYQKFQAIDDLRAVAHYYNNLGAEALLAGAPEQAAHFTERALALVPDFFKAINNLGVAMVRLQRLPEAVAIYRRGLDLAPQNPALLGNLASAYQRQGQQAEALLLLERLSALREASPWVFLHRGELALGRGAPEEALNFLAEALRRNRDLPEVHLGLVKVYLALGDLKRARHHLERVLRLAPQNAEAAEYRALLDT